METESLLNLEIQELFSLGYRVVKITYIDKSIKNFTIPQFDIHKKNIIKNLYKRNRCKIEFKKESNLKRIVKIAKRIKPKSRKCYSCNRNTLTIKLKNGAFCCRKCGAIYDNAEIELIKRNS